MGINLELPLGDNAVFRRGGKMEKHIISVMAKGLESLRKIAEVVQQSGILPRAINGWHPEEEDEIKRRGKSKTVLSHEASSSSSSGRPYRGTFRSMTRWRWQRIETAFAQSADGGSVISLVQAYDVIFTDAEKSAYLHDDFVHDLSIFRRLRGCSDVSQSSSVHLSEIRPFLDAMR